MDGVESRNVTAQRLHDKRGHGISDISESPLEPKPGCNINSCLYSSSLTHKPPLRHVLAIFLGTGGGTCSSYMASNCQHPGLWYWKICRHDEMVTDYVYKKPREGISNERFARLLYDASIKRTVTTGDLGALASLLPSS